MIRYGGKRCLDNSLLSTCQRINRPSCTQFRAISSDTKDWLHLYKNTLQRQVPTHEIGQLSTKDVGEKVVLHGYLGPGRRRDLSKKLSFWDISSHEDSKHVQIVLFNPKKTEEDAKRSQWLHLPPQSPVVIRGTVKAKQLPKDTNNTSHLLKEHEKIEVDLEDVMALNIFPSDLEATEATNFTAEQRHLELRKGQLKTALQHRAAAASVCRNVLKQSGFLEVETPMLFKSTPEGAREFLVPTRTKGMAYALPQSPQQYKQILMASGVPKYYQFARCFRDEDLRADRQPEFTQLDLEMSFADEHTVMKVVEDIVRRVWYETIRHGLPEFFPQMTYEEAMSRYGSDKPDLRFDMEIVSCDELFPKEENTLRFNKDDSFTIDAIMLPEALPEQVVRDFLASAEAAEFANNPDGRPEIAVEQGSLLLCQARKRQPFSGGSTALGRLRLALQKHAVEMGIFEKPTGFKFLWITDFPLFSPTNDADPGQGGTAGLSSTHHPFTAPLTAEDVDFLATHPEKARAAHYDLVVNGVELGGGSRRIHVAAVQEYVFRDILRMPEQRIDDFRHLLTVLSHGCPPHAGIALGFDRLMVVLLGLDSVRDVIAFPKTGSGEDLLVKSPNRLTEEQLTNYHLRLN